MLSGIISASTWWTMKWPSVGSARPRRPFGIWVSVSLKGVHQVNESGMEGSPGWWGECSGGSPRVSLSVGVSAPRLCLVLVMAIAECPV